MSGEQTRQKELAGRWAADCVRTGTTIGLGTGSTISFTILRLGERVRKEGLRIRGVATSEASARLAEAAGVPLIPLGECPLIDLTIDGADEVDPEGNLIKGGGGALLREKIVAHFSREVTIVVDTSKRVERLGLGFRLPVEVLEFALRSVVRELELLKVPAYERLGESGAPFLTDNGHRILDLEFAGGISDPAGLERQLDAIPGIVESGLFIGMVDTLVVGRDVEPEIVCFGRAFRR